MPASQPAQSGKARPVTAVWLLLRSQSRRRWRAWLSLALIVGVSAGGVMTAVSGARRTGSAYARFLDWSRAPDALVDAVPYNPRFATLPSGVVLHVPQAAEGTVIKSFNPSPNIVQFIAPASDAVPGRFWGRKILSGRLADPDRPGEINVSFTLAQRLHLRAGGSLRLTMETTADRRVPFVFRIAGIDAAQAEFPPQPGNGTFIAWGTPAFYRAHPALSGFVQVALRFRDGSRDWPAVLRELSKAGHRKLPEASLLSLQSRNTQRSISPQAVALWLLAVLFGVIGLLILGQLLARMTLLEATDYGTLRALGMSRSQLTMACAVRGAVIGAVGGVAGAALAVALSPLLPVGLARVAEPRPGADVDVLVLPTGLLAAIGVTVACSVWSGWRATAPAPPAPPARPARPRGRMRIPRLAPGPVPLTMGVHLALHRGAGRTAVPVGSAVASATVGVAALSAAIVFGGCISHLLASPVLFGVTWDAAVTGTALPNVAPIEATARRDPQVAAWTTVLSGGPVQIGPSEADMLVLPATGSSFLPAPVTGRLPRTSREIALGTRTLHQARARIGEALPVSVDGQPARRMTVVGTTVFPTTSDELDLGTGAALTPGGLSYLLPAGLSLSADTVFVRFKAGVSPQAGRRALAARLGQPGQFVVDGPATPTDLLNFGQVQDLPQLLAAGLGCVALLTIGHLLITSVRRRQRDLAILRVLGFTTWQVRRTLGWQAITLAGLALVIGVPAGIVCGRLGWLVFAHQLGITPVVAVPLALLVAMALGWMAAAAAIAAVPGEIAVRSRPARALRTE